MKKQLLMLLLAATTIYAQEEVVEEAVETPNLTATNVSTIVETTPAETTTNTTIYVDTVGYTISDGETLFASPMARFEVQGVDEQSGLKEILVSVDGGVYAPYKGPISFTTEGEHSLNYQFIDKVGNVSYSKVFSVTVDATAPRVLDINVTPAPYYASGMDFVGPNSEITFTSYDDVVGVAFIEFGVKDQEMTKYATNTSFASLGYTSTSKVQIDYHSTDMVSNVSPVKSHIFAVDATAPTVDVFAKAVEIDGVRYISSKDTIYVEAHDNETAVEDIMFSINNSEYQSYDPAIGINIKQSGEYLVLAKAVDVVGNESDAVEYKVVVDTLAPTGDALYIGEVRSTEYNPLASDETTESTPATAIETTSTTVEVSAPAPTDEMPAGTAVEAMTTAE